MSVCSTLKHQYETLKTLTQEFVSVCAKVGGSAELTTSNFQHLSTQDLRILQLLKQKLETARDSLREKINIIFHVPDAQNPYREALLESGILDIEKNPLSAETKEMTWNLRDEVRKQQAIYRSMGLDAWADNIATIDFTHLTKEQRETIKQEIKDGAIPIIMPDRTTQLNNTSVDQFKKSFKPTYIEKGKEETANDAYLEWDHFIDLIDTKTVIPEPEPGKKCEVPDQPYLSFIKPTQRPDEGTTGKTVDEQKKELIRMNIKRAEDGLEPVYVLTPHEYGALQTIFSRLLQENMPFVPTVLNPLDTETWTRFINLPISGGSVPGADWSPGNRRLRFGWDGAGFPNANGGFRLAVRLR